MQPRIAYYKLFAIILVTGEVAKPHILWNQLKTRLYNNVKHKLCHMNHYQIDQDIPEDNICDYGL